MTYDKREIRTKVSLVVTGNSLSTAGLYGTRLIDSTDKQIVITSMKTVYILSEQFTQPLRYYNNWTLYN